jgi:hypothetical protein
MTRRVFVSDTHMSCGKSLGTKGEYEWFDKQDAANFLSFLAYLQTYDFQELILLGDIIDDWLYPIDETPPSYEDIAKAAHIAPILQELGNSRHPREVSVSRTSRGTMTWT